MGELNVVRVTAACVPRRGCQRLPPSSSSLIEESVEQGVARGQQRRQRRRQSVGSSGASDSHTLSSWEAESVARTVRKEWMLLHGSELLSGCASDWTHGDECCNFFQLHQKPVTMSSSDHMPHLPRDTACQVSL